MKVSVLYLAIDVNFKGGIQRYSRAQIQSLREILGLDQVAVLVLHPLPEGHLGFEEPFEIMHVEKNKNFLGRISFSLRAIFKSLRDNPDIIWVNHVKLFPLANFIRFISRTRTVVGNVYGLEIWSSLSALENNSFRKLTHIVSDAFFTANYVHENFNVPEDHISVIWDPVDINRFAFRKSADRILQKYGVPYHADDCYLMTLGRVSVNSRHKGYDRMLDVMHLINNKNVVYLIVGEGDDRKRLEMRVATENLVGQVYCLGGVTESDLVDIYNAADIFVLVSDRSPGRGEGVPLSPLEAASCSIPIIVGNEDGSLEAVEEGVNGFIVSPRDIDQIKTAILTLVEDPVLRKTMGRAARIKVETDFSYAAFRNRVKNTLSGLRIDPPN